MTVAKPSFGGGFPHEGSQDPLGTPVGGRRLGPVTAVLLDGRAVEVGLTFPNQHGATRLIGKTEAPEVASSTLRMVDNAMPGGHLRVSVSPSNGAGDCGVVAEAGRVPSSTR